MRPEQRAGTSRVPQSSCICYPGMCPQGCEPACPYCFQPPETNDGRMCGDGHMCFDAACAKECSRG